MVLTLKRLWSLDELPTDDDDVDFLQLPTKLIGYLRRQHMLVADMINKCTLAFVGGRLAASPNRSKANVNVGASIWRKLNIECRPPSSWLLLVLIGAVSHHQHVDIRGAMM